MFYYNSGFSVVKALKKLYNVNRVPTLVINGQQYDQLVEEDELKEILEKQSY